MAREVRFAAAAAAAAVAAADIAAGVAAAASDGARKARISLGGQRPKDRWLKENKATPRWGLKRDFLNAVAAAVAAVGAAVAAAAVVAGGAPGAAFVAAAILSWGDDPTVTVVPGFMAHMSEIHRTSDVGSLRGSSKRQTQMDSKMSLNQTPSGCSS